MEFDFEYAQPEAAPLMHREREGPVRLLLLADLSGRANRGGVAHGEDLAARPIVRVDVDLFDRVLSGYAPRLSLAPAGAGTPAFEVEFRDLDDFHPDRLYRDLELFGGFRDTRRRLLDPRTFAEEAGRLAPPAGAGSAAAPTAEEDAAAIERLLGRRPAAPADSRPGPRGATAALDLDGLIRSVVAPHVVPDRAAEQEHLVRAVDQAAAEQMRRLLHDPALQALESAWRQIHGLVTGLETGERLELALLDVAREELSADLAGARDDLASSGLYRLLVEQGSAAPDRPALGAIVGHYSFGTSAEDVSLLAGLGAIASHCRAPFLAGARPQVVGAPDGEGLADAATWSPPEVGDRQRWQALRRSGVAGWIGLALPRILQRLPYGARGETVETFEFEEFAGEPRHEDYLWGGPAFACAALIGAAIVEGGEPGDRLDLDDLPAHTFESGGETRLKPCAEVLLSERAAGEILGHGPMPWMSYSGRNAARLLRFQSLADPPTALPWSWSPGGA